MLCLSPLLALISLAEGSIPSPDLLIQQAIAVRKAQDAKGLKFTWREDVEQKDEKGKPLHPFLRTFDVIMLEGDSYRKLILLDGKPLDAKTEKKVEEDLEKTRQERMRHKFMNKVVPLGDLDQLARLFDSKIAGEETIGGRKTWRVESDPRPGAIGANPAEEEVLATHRTTWFDKEEGIDLRRETIYLRAVNKIQARTRGEIEWSKVGDVWLPATSYFHGDIRFFPGFRSFGDSRRRCYDYRKFTAESTFTPN